MVLLIFCGGFLYLWNGHVQGGGISRIDVIHNALGHFYTLK
jgi:hypothetical protein